MTTVIKNGTAYQNGRLVKATICLFKLSALIIDNLSSNSASVNTLFSLFCFSD